MFLLTRFVQHVLGFVIHSLSFRRSMSPLDNIAGYRHDIVVALVDLLFVQWTRPASQKKMQSGHCCFEDVSQSSASMKKMALVNGALTKIGKIGICRKSSNMYVPPSSS